MALIEMMQAAVAAAKSDVSVSLVATIEHACLRLTGPAAGAWLCLASASSLGKYLDPANASLALVPARAASVVAAPAEALQAKLPEAADAAIADADGAHEAAC